MITHAPPVAGNVITYQMLAATVSNQLVVLSLLCYVHVLACVVQLKQLKMAKYSSQDGKCTMYMICFSPFNA